MADAVAAFQEAFSSYGKNVVDVVVYSIITNLLWVVLMGMLVAAAVVLGVLSTGSVISVFASGEGFSMGILGLAAGLLVVFLGLLVFLWVGGGVNGAYFDTLNMLLQGRKQTFGGFFAAMPKRATTMLLISAIALVVVAIPAAVGVLLMGVLGGFAGIAAMLAFMLLGMLLSLFLAFAIPAAIVDGKGALPAVEASFSMVPRNIVGVFVYIVISGILGVGMLIPLVNALYGPLVYLPIVETALLSLYKRAK